jgi:4-hydroxy-tetrahydrodipicolinate synthase
VTTGTIPALLTPLAAGGAELDLGVLDAHVAWLHERGVRTVSALGTTGEGASLSLAERKRVIERLAGHASGMELMAGTGCTSLPETIELSRFAVERGASLLLAPPSYYPPTTGGTTAYLMRVLEALPAGARVFLYHIPSHTKVPIEDETIRALHERFGPTLAGAKDSGGDFDHVAAWLRDFPELTILPGSDSMAAQAYAAGARGTITMLGNLLPEELEGIRRGDDVERRQGLLSAARDLAGEYPRLSALKQLLHVVSGLPRTAVRPPNEELTDEQAAELETRFHELRSEIHV